jgi:hypothetical protein
MKTLALKLAVTVSALSLVLVGAPRAAFAQEATEAPPAPPPPPTEAPPSPQAQAPQDQPDVQQSAPSAGGQWVYSQTYGWIWVPGGTTSYSVNSEPYVYLYTPSYGWTWYASPWGWGPFFVGPWVHRAFVPHVWFGSHWGAPPAVHYGGFGGAHYHYGPAFHGAPAYHSAPAFHGAPTYHAPAVHAPAAHGGYGGGHGGGGGGHHR